MIVFENVGKNYGNVEAVKSLDLKIPPGECFGFLGPNGAGKTTTIKMLAGLLIPTSGRVFIEGHDIQKEPEKAKGVIGFIPDNPFIYEKLTGNEFLDFMLDLYGMKREEAVDERRKFLELFSLVEWQDELVENYSHGMKQKLVITGALIHKPKVLIIDEPMVGLDPHGHIVVKRMFKKFCEAGSSIFMSTHTLNVAEELCHRIAILDKGEIIAIGTLKELQSRANMESGRLESIFLKLTAPNIADQY